MVTTTTNRVLVYLALRTGKFECVECGDEGPHDDNGCSGEDQAFCCRACGTHMDAELVARAVLPAWSAHGPLTTMLVNATERRS